MKNNILDRNCATQLLKTKVLPEALLIYDLVTAIPPLLPYPRDNDGKSPTDTIWVTATSATALWYERRQTTKDNHYGMALDLSSSAAMAVKFMHALYRGEEDRILPDMLYNCKAMTPVLKLNYGGLCGGGFKERLVDTFNKDTEVAPPQPLEPAEPEIDPDLLERDRKLQELMTLKAVPRTKDSRGCGMDVT